MYEKSFGLRVSSFHVTTQSQRGILPCKYVFSNLCLDTLPDHRCHTPPRPGSSHLLRYLAIHRNDLYLPISQLQTSTRVILIHRLPHLRSCHRHYPLGRNFPRALERHDTQAGTALVAAS